MNYKTQKNFFSQAYNLKDKRISSGYGWPNEPDKELIKDFTDLEEQLPSGRILDLGCGQGRHTLYAAKQGYDAYGIDYIQKPLDEAQEEAEKENLTNTHFLYMDVLKLRFPKNYFDIIIDWSVLDHMQPKDWDTYSANIRSVLKIGGFLLLCEFSAADKRIKNKSNNFSLDRGSYDHYFRRDEIKSIFAHNFAIISLRNVTFHQPPNLPHTMVYGILRKIK